MNLDLFEIMMELDQVPSFLFPIFVFGLETAVSRNFGRIDARIVSLVLQ